MIDKKALSQKLTALAASNAKFEDGLRVISDGSAVSPLISVLETIDETVLDRKLTFRIGTSYVTVVVAGRRLQGITKVSGDLNGALKIMGKILSHEDSELMAGVADVMRQFGERTGQVTVASEPTAKMGTQSDAGVGFSTLQAAWGVDVLLTPPTPLGQFIINCGASVNASLIIAQGEIVRANGDKAIQDKLQDIANDQWGAFDTARANLHKTDSQEPALVCVNAGIGDDTSLAVAKKDEEVSFFVFESDQLSKVYSAWRETAAA